MNLSRTFKYISVKSLFVLVKSHQKVPNKKILHSFHAKYPKATFATWLQKDIFNWQVDFSWKKKEYTALFDSDALWLETRTLALFDFIPLKAQRLFNRNYKRTGIQRIWQVYTPHAEFYEVLWKNELYGLKLLFDFSGNILQKSIL